MGNCPETLVATSAVWCMSRGVTVRRGVQNGLQRVAGIGPGDGYSQNIFGKQLILCDDFRHLAGDDIVEAAGRIRLDDTDFLRGILGGLRRNPPLECCQRSQYGNVPERLSKFHFALLAG